MDFFLGIQVMILEVKKPKCQWQNTNLVTMDNWFINLGMYHPRHGNGGRGMPMQPMQPGGHTFASGYFRWILRDHEVPHQQQAGSDGFWPTFKGEVMTQDDTNKVDPGDTGTYRDPA